MNSQESDLFDDHDPVEEAAVAWLIERDEGFAPGRAKEFERWRTANPQHAAAVERLKETWSILEELPPVAAGATRQSHQSAARVMWSRAAVVWSLAAAAALMLGFFWWRNDLRNPNEGYATAAGMLRKIDLPDGSTVTLNANSDAKVQYSSAARRVLLDAGEAHFEVAHDEARPFLVTAGGVTVRAVGTAFNVRLAAASIEVVVASGKVRLSSPEQSAGTKPETPAAAPLLEKGDRAVVPRGAADVIPIITRLEPEQLQEAIAWQEAMLVFSETPLREVIAQFNRHNRTQLHLGDADLGGRRVGGAFAAGNVEAFVSLLERGGDLKAERRGDREIVLRKAQ
jgi:transmembrane sensor